MSEHKNTESTANPSTSSPEPAAWGVSTPGFRAMVMFQGESAEGDARYYASLKEGRQARPLVFMDTENPRYQAQTPPQGMDRTRKVIASQTARDGIGAMDALYELAVKHGASSGAAAGFAHTTNAALATLEGQVHDEIHRCASLSSNPGTVDFSGIQTPLLPGTDYTDIANRAQEATGRSIWPSTAKAVLQAAGPAHSVCRKDVERFLSDYHAIVWTAAQSDDPNRPGYDEAGEHLAGQFLERFGEAL